MDVNEDAVFCGNCGQAVPVTEQVMRLQQHQPNVDAPSPPPLHAPQLVGIYRELEPMEQLIHQGAAQTYVIFVKEAHIKKVIGQERKEIPISISTCHVFLTNERLIFLKLFEMSATELGRGQNLLSGVSGTFYEIPLSAVTAVETRPIKLNRNDEERFASFFGQNASLLERPALEIVYDEKAATGRARDYMESMMQRGMFSKMWGKVQMVYDKIFIIGEQSVVLKPALSERVRQKSAPRQ